MDAKRRDVAIQEFKHIVRTRFGAASPVTSAVNKELVKFVQGNVETDKVLIQLKKYIETTPHEDVLNAYETFKDKVGNQTVTFNPSTNSDYDMNDQNIMDRVHTRMATPRSTSTKQERRTPRLNGKNRSPPSSTQPATEMSFKAMVSSLLPSFKLSSFLETMEGMKVKVVDNSTYWTGDRCQICNMPEQIPCADGEVFDLTKCACSHECPKPELKCLNGGKINEGTCHCKCIPGYGGKVCEYHLDGLTKQTAVHSCKQLIRLNPDTPSGGYWVKPKKHTEAFLTKCDMGMDGGGWTQIARINNAKNVNYDSISYMEGVTASNSPSLSDDFILPCAHFDGLDHSKSLHRFIVRVSMGSVRDYFKLVDEQNSNLCDMLTSDDKHLWSANGGGVGTSMPSDRANMANTGWIQPEHSDISAIKILGGSNETWPRRIDGRKYLSIWGGYKGGCCHYSSNIYPDENGHGVDGGQWSRGFSIHIKEMPYIKPDHPVVDTPEPIIPKAPVMEPLKPNTRQVDDDSSSRNLFSRSSKSKIPNMLTDGGKKKEFMNTMFLQGSTDNTNINRKEAKSLESELPWFDANKKMNLQ
jgi:hypothetical protein